MHYTCLGKNNGVKTEFLSQAKTTDFVIWLERKFLPIQADPFQKGLDDRKTNQKQWRRIPCKNGGVGGVGGEF